MIEGAEEEIIEKIKKSEAKDNKVVKVVECQARFTPGWKSAEWTQR